MRYQNQKFGEENKEFTFFSRRLLDELKTFIWNNGKPQAITGKNDDLVMSFAILCWVRDTVIKEDVKSVQHSVAVMQAFKKKGRTIDTTLQPGHNYHVGPYLGRGTKSQAQKNAFKEQAKMYRKYAGLLKG